MQLELIFTRPAKRAKMRCGGLRFPGHVRDCDLADFNAAQQVCWDLLRDGAWHKAQEFIEATGQREGVRRIRELRQKLEAAGQGTIETRRKTGREFEYKYLKNTQQSTTVSENITRTSDARPGRENV